MIPEDKFPDRIFLVGYRGSGKTTLAQALAARLGFEWCDADAVLETRFGKTIRQTFAEDGEPVFRDREALVLADLSQRQRIIVATGGGVILREDNRQNLRRGFVIYLTATPETLYQRMTLDPTTGERRPNLSVGGIEEVREMVAKRDPIYRNCADLIVDTEAKATDALVDEVIARSPLFWPSRSASARR